MAFALRFVCECIRDIENILLSKLLQRFPTAPALVAHPANQDTSQTPSLVELLQDPFLWAVPKKRRSVEKRRTRKYGSPKYGMKIYLKKTDILVCKYCYGYHEAGALCRNCYDKVINETKLIQNKIQKALGNSPIEEEVVVLYEGEQKRDSQYWKGKRIIEMEKPCPNFFSQNLLQRSTQQNAKTTDVEEVPKVK